MALALSFTGERETNDGKGDSSTLCFWSLVPCPDDSKSCVLVRNVIKTEYLIS